MKIIIHRGTHEIGGCAVEYCTGSARILVDYGLPLDKNSPPDLPIAGVTDDTAPCDGVFFTHSHGDHIGLLDRIRDGIPLYTSAFGKELLLLTGGGDRSPGSMERLKRLCTYEAGTPIMVGDMKITPFFVDHSAFDAHMFLIEADGKRVLHTGDFRGHGYRGKGLLPTLRHYVGKVDALVCEGTTLGRNSRFPMSERELARRAGQKMRENPYVFMVCASTNIDRIAGISSAVPRGRYLLCDRYQKEVTELAERYAHSPLYQFPKLRTYGENLEDQMLRYGFGMFVRPQNPAHQRLMRAWQDRDPLVLYSMWDGYLKKPELSDALEGFRVEHLHTSGHAALETIRQVIEITEPEKLIPMHTEIPEAFCRLTDPEKVLLLSDGEPFEI